MRTSAELATHLSAEERHVKDEHPSACSRNDVLMTIALAIWSRTTHRPIIPKLLSLRTNRLVHES